VVLELLRGAGLESTCRKHGVTAATLSEWREAFLAAGEEGLKIRQEDLVDEQGRRMKSVMADLAMENDLLRERIQGMEDEQPFLPRTRNRVILPARPSW
jgi:transposase-like protein